MKQSEKELQNSILEYLNYKGHFCWRNSSGAFKNDKGGMYWFGKKGSSDILGIAKDGKFIAVEVKIKGNKPTLYQNMFIEEINHRGGYGIICYSLEEIQKYL